MHLDRLQAVIFLRDSRVGEHVSVRENHTTIPEKNEGLLVVHHLEGLIIYLDDRDFLTLHNLQMQLKYSL